MPKIPLRPFWATSDGETVRLYQGDCLALLKKLPLARLIFADPPNNFGIDYGKGGQADRLPKQEYLNWCRQWLLACKESLSADGSLWVLVPDEWAGYFVVMLDGMGLYRRSWIKWYETFGVNCTRKFNRCSRHLLYYVVNPKQFIFNRQAVTRPSDRQVKYSDKRARPDGKVWDDVWSIPRLAGTHQERIKGFPTQLPKKLLQPIIGCATDPGDLVIDPFSGSATTGAVCLELKRQYIGIELEERFCALASARLNELIC